MRKPRTNPNPMERKKRKFKELFGSKKKEEEIGPYGYLRDQRHNGLRPATRK